MRSITESSAGVSFDAMLDRMLSGAAFSGRNNWVWVELPRAYMLHKAQLEVGRVDAARQGLDKLLAMTELRVHGELHWQVLLDRAVIAERDGDNALALRSASVSAAMTSRVPSAAIRAAPVTSRTGRQTSSCHPPASGMISSTVC